GLQGRQDDKLKLAGEARGVKQAQRGAAQNIALLRSLQLLAHEGLALEPPLHGRVAAALEPFDQHLDLSGAPGPVGAFDDDELAGQLLQIDPGDAVPIKAPFTPVRDDDVVGGDAFPSTGSSTTFAFLCGSAGGLGGGRSARWKLARSTRCVTSSRTTACCFSTSWFASTTRKLNSVLMARYCSRMRPWKMRKLS